jgi:tetratricopeptide (TPR) repeat protein
MASFAELRDRGREVLEAGRLEEALGYFERALAVARQGGDEELVDLAIANRGAVLISLGRKLEVIPSLREILVRNHSVANCFIAAYNLSRAYYEGKEAKKGLFYARIARERAQALENREWLASAHIQVGLGLLLESYFKEAEAEYRWALTLGLSETSVEHAAILAHLGYCLMALDQPEKGIRMALVALRQFRHRDAKLYEGWPELILSYGYLEVDRVDRARQHGQRALELAENSGDVELMKTGLFILGEVEKTAGRHEAAHRYFTRLQCRFYSESPELVTLMMSVGMRKIVNLRA